MKEASLRARVRTAIPYVLTVVTLNVGFSLSPDIDWFWSLLVGIVLVLRDYTQRVWGHWCLALMALAALLSYLLGSPEVALASASAFAVSETVDWAVYTATKRPFADRVLLSTATSAPVDSAVFLTLAHIFSWQLFIIGVASKIAAGVFVWTTLRWRHGTEYVPAIAPNRSLRSADRSCPRVALVVYRPTGGVHDEVAERAVRFDRQGGVDHRRKPRIGARDGARVCARRCRRRHRQPQERRVRGNRARG